MLEANGTQLRLNCSWVHLDLGDDVAQPLLTLPGTACGPDLVSSPSWQDQREGCLDKQCAGLSVPQCRYRLSGGPMRASNRAASCHPASPSFSVCKSRVVASQGQ